MSRTSYAPFVLGLLAVSLPGWAAPTFSDVGEPDGEEHVQTIRDRENLANLLNHAQVSIHVIKAFNNRIILDREYRTIINNLNLREIPDQRVIELLKSLMDSLTQATLTDREREQVQRLHTARVKQSFRKFARSSAETVAGTAMALAAQDRVAAAKGVVSVGMAYWDYQALLEQMQVDKEEKNWDLDGEVLQQINVINKKMLELSWQLYNEYDVPEDWRLVEEKISSLTEMTRERDAEKRFRMLDRPYMRDQFSRFAPYWFYVGSSAQQLFIDSGAARFRERALEAYDRYEQTRSPILKTDEMYAAVSLGRSHFLDPDREQAQIAANLEIIEKDPPSNAMLISGMALLYAQIGNESKAREWAQHNIDRASDDGVLHQQVMASILASSEDREALRQLIDRMVLGSSAQTFEILEMVGPLDPLQIANSLRPRLVSVQPAIEERTMRSDHILLEVPLALEADMKELKLFAGKLVYDPGSGLVTVDSEARDPDEVDHSENGKRVTFRFEGVFDPAEWEAEGAFGVDGKNTKDATIAAGKVLGAVVVGAALGGPLVGAAAGAAVSGVFDDTVAGDAVSEILQEAGIGGAVDEGRTHALFVLREGNRSIGLLYAIVAQPDSDPAFRFELKQIAIDDVQFIEKDGGFVAAAPLLKAEFDASLAGLIYALSRRYGLEAEEGQVEASAVAAVVEQRDASSLRELVRRMKADPHTSYLDILEVARAQRKPRETLQTLPFSNLQMNHEENLLGASYSLGSSALSYVGAGEYGEGREDLVLRLPSKWLNGEGTVSTILVIGKETIEGDEPILDEETDTHEISFGSAYHVAEWKEREIDRFVVRFPGAEPMLLLHYRVSLPGDTSELALALETIELGKTRIAP